MELRTKMHSYLLIEPTISVLSSKNTKKRVWKLIGILSCLYFLVPATILRSVIVCAGNSRHGVSYMNWEELMTM